LCILRGCGQCTRNHTTAATLAILRYWHRAGGGVGRGGGMGENQHRHPITNELCCPLVGNFRHCDEDGRSLGRHTFSQRRCSEHQLPGQRNLASLVRSSNGSITAHRDVREGGKGYMLLAWRKRQLLRPWRDRFDSLPGSAS